MLTYGKRNVALGKLLHLYPPTVYHFGLARHNECIYCLLCISVGFAAFIGFKCSTWFNCLSWRKNIKTFWRTIECMNLVLGNCAIMPCKHMYYLECTPCLCACALPLMFVLCVMKWFSIQLVYLVICWLELVVPLMLPLSSQLWRVCFFQMHAIWQIAPLIVVHYFEQYAVTRMYRPFRKFPLIVFDV